MNVQGNSTNQGNLRDWRTLCEEVLKARGTDRINALLAELLEVLEERERAISDERSRKDQF